MDLLPRIVLRFFPAQTTYSQDIRRKHQQDIEDDGSIINGAEHKERRSPKAVRRHVLSLDGVTG